MVSAAADHNAIRATRLVRVLQAAPIATRRRCANQKPADSPGVRAADVPAPDPHAGAIGSSSGQPTSGCGRSHASTCSTKTSVSRRLSIVPLTDSIFARMGIDNVSLPGWPAPTGMSLSECGCCRDVGHNFGYNGWGVGKFEHGTDNLLFVRRPL
jgi:hypothetical protein